MSSSETILNKDGFDEEIGFFRDMGFFKNTSTPTKSRRSVSLLDVSGIDKELIAKEHTLSSETIGSHTSLFKDSGYNHTGSSSSLGSGSKEKDKRIFDLEEELKYKQVLINELEDSNHCLRMRVAESENKISELRLRSESHCNCCNSCKGEPAPTTEKRLMITNNVKDTFEPKTFSEFLDETDSSKFTVQSSKSHQNTGRCKTIGEAFEKVKQWQTTVEAASQALTPCQEVEKKPETRSKLSSKSDSSMINNLPVPFHMQIGDHSVSVSSSSNTPRSQKRVKDENINMKLRNLHKTGRSEVYCVNSDSWAYASSGSDDENSYNKLFDPHEDRWLDDRRKLRLEEESSCCIKPLGTFLCRNHKLEMEERIRSGMNNIASYGRRRRSIGEPFDCWKKSLQPKPDELGRNFGQKIMPELLQKIKEAKSCSKEVDKMHSKVLQKMNKLCPLVRGN